MGSAVLLWLSFFFQAEDGIRDLGRSRGLGDVYKRQLQNYSFNSQAGYLGLFGALMGALLGAVVFVVLDRRS